MNNTPMRSGQGPDEYLYMLDSCRDRLNACHPPEGPIDRQHDDIILQTLSPEYKAIRQPHLERGKFGLTYISRGRILLFPGELDEWPYTWVEELEV